jgi:hypothetical protein
MYSAQATDPREESLGQSNNLRSEVSQAVRRQLEAIGFERRSDEICSCPLGAHALGWIGFGSVRRRSLFRVHLSVDPVIGVRHLPTERLVAGLLQERLAHYGPPTLSTPLGHVLPGHELRPWLFIDGDDPGELAERMIWTVRTFGLPFLREHTALGALAQTLASPGFGFPGQTHLRLPAIYHLLGQNERAESYLADRLVRLGRRADPDAKYYRRFASALLNHMACPGLEHGIDACGA